MAWECLTQVFGLAPDRIYATYFGGDERLQLGPDEEARKIWLVNPLQSQRTAHDLVTDTYCHQSDLSSPGLAALFLRHLSCIRYQSQPDAFGSCPVAPSG